MEAERFGIVFNSLLQDINLPVMAFNCLKAAMSVGFVCIAKTVSAMPAVHTVLVSIYAGTIGTLGSLGAGTLSGLTALTTSAGTFGAFLTTNVVTPMMPFIMPFIGTVARDEAFKAFKPANNTTDNTFDVETEKAKREVNKQISNLVEEKVPGTGNWMQVFLKNFSIREIWNCIRDFLIFITTVCGMCCNICKFKKHKVLTIPPPQERRNRRHQRNCRQKRG